MGDPASTLTLTGAETRVGPSTPETITPAGVSDHIAAGQGRIPLVLGRQIVVATGVAGNTAARACSFSGSTPVLLTDGTKKSIDQVLVGERVVATDPETGEQVAKTVEHVFVHDDTLTDLALADGTFLTTTEDHPYWSVDDQRFERADEPAAGEQLRRADGRTVQVSGLRLATTHAGRAYNLSVEGIHTYHVGADAVLVHNDCGLLLSRTQGARMTTPQATELANWPGYTRVKGATSHGQASVDGFGPNQRLGTYDFLLQGFAK